MREVRSVQEGFQTKNLFQQVQLRALNQYSMQKLMHQLQTIQHFFHVDSPIVQGLAKRTEQRRIKLKKFNYKFTKPKTMGDLESEPAYKRAGISLDDEIKNSISSSTLNHEESGKIDVKSNNTFLHDNVD